MTVKWFYIILIERGKISYVYMEVNKVFVGRCQNIKIDVYKRQALDKEKTYILLRYKTREKYNNSQVRIIIVMAAIFSAVRQIVDYIFTEMCIRDRLKIYGIYSFV